MALFKRGSKAPKGVGSRPATGAVPEGGYGSGPVPGRAQKTSAIKSKPEGGGGSYGQKHSWQQDTKGRMKS